MNNEQIRAAVMKAYPGKAWQKKVKAMDDHRLYALYKALQLQGKVK
jgi:hypothetical protein